MFPETSRRADFAITAGILVRTSEEDGSRSRSLPIALPVDDQAPIPHHDGTTGLSESRLGTGPSGLSYSNKAEHQQPSNLDRAPNVLPVQTSQHVEIMHQNVSHTTTTPLYTFSHRQPWTSASAVPNPPSPVHQQPPWHGPVQSSTFVGPSSPIQGQTPHVFDNPTAFSPRYTARADSQQILAPSSHSPSEYAASGELELGLERESTSRDPWAGFSSEDMPESDLLFLQLVYGDVGGGRIYENINDARTALAAGLDLRAISEAWMSGLRAADAQSSA
ncbi:hypothetical protein LXA43DRAFT_1043544 [Ganoderma leucocontextum]|nr:hypothetical protein LXA43DRAFT_1043544 [Ganoderma leucocontextum]